MTTKMKKGKTDILIEPMVGSLVLQRASDRAFLHPNERATVVYLHQAAEFTHESDAVDVADDYLASCADQQTWYVMKVLDAIGNLKMVRAIVPGDAPAQGELLPPDAGTAVVTPTNGLQLNSPGAARMTAIGLKTYAADLKKEAKNLRELGKEKEAQSCDADATVITQTLLPQLEPQVKIPFGYADVKAALSARISGALRSKLSEQIRRDTPIIAGETDKDRQDKVASKIDDFEELVGSTASIVTALVEPCIARAAEQGMLAGRLARETTADTLALEAIESVMAA